MQHYRIATVSRRKLTKSTRHEYVRGEDAALDSVRERMAKPGVIFITLKPVSEAAFVRATRSD